MRLDIWHAHAKNAGLLPAEVAGLDVEEVEDLLGFCRSARYRPCPRFVFPDGWVREEADGSMLTTIYNFPGGELRKVLHHSPEEKRSGLRGHLVRYPIQTESDCRAYLDALDAATLHLSIEGYGDFDRRTGERGLPMLILGPCPGNQVMLELMGYENFYYANADYPDLLGALIRKIGRRFRAEVWPAAFQSGAELLLHGEHFSDTNYPPALFEKHFLPYLAEFASEAHACGRYVLWHADAAMGSLKKYALDARVDGADCLATWPLVPHTLEEYHEAWQGRVVCWGGLPSVVFQPEYPADTFERGLRHLREFTSGKAGIIVGVSDNVMPGALWERILAVRDAFADPNAG
jgi:hypothetical protein